MTAGKLKSYRFATEVQWSKCIFVQTDREAFRKGEGIRPSAAFARPATVYESRGAYAPVVTSTREILWRDDRCSLHRLALCDNDQPETTIAPHAIACADRLVSTRSGLWVKGGRPGSLERYEDETLTRLLIARTPEANVIDIASGGHGSVWALIERDGAFFAVQVDRNGQSDNPITFKGVSEAEAFVFLKRESRFVVLTGGEHPKLHWFEMEGGAASFKLAVEALRTCFKANVLGSDSRDRVFLAGADDHGLGSAFVLMFDADGNSIGDVAIDPQDAPVTGITASRNHLLVTCRRGLLRFTTTDVVPEGTEHLQCMLVTPSLFSPDREDRRRWLRVEATGRFPEGSTLEISWAATDKAPAPASAISRDDSVSASQAARKVLTEDYSRRGRTVFQGAADTERKDEKQTLSVGLFDVAERHLRVCITLTAGAGGRLPVLSELNVLYPGRTLMENLPAIYQREESQPNSFLRRLVGVLETTTQGIDARIASMGSQIHPAIAQEPWLDFIARWLGVPWDDGLTLEQKRAIVMRAPDLTKMRGSRAGLETLLEALIPGEPPRFRVTDATADNGFAVVGGGTSCEGSKLPAMLGGYTRWRPELGLGAVLGYMRLPCADQLDDGAWQLAGTVEVEVAATAEQRAAWKPWLRALIEQMIPLTARLKFRWVTAQSLRGDRLDGTITLEDPPAPHLGTDAITGLARFPEQPTRLSTCGEAIGTRLR